jgi:hypothetical protein
MSSNGHAAEVIRGTVQRCNGSSVILHERHDPLTISRYAKDLPTLEGGDTVELSVDARGFIMGAVILNAPAPPPVKGGSPDIAVRESVLAAAAAFASSRPDIKSADVLKIAECWEAWVLR